MPIPTAPADICTMATDYLKTDGVNNLSPATKTVEALCNRWYDVARQSVLSLFPFTFAKSRATLSLAAIAPAFGYPDRYQLPKDFLTLQFVNVEGAPLTQASYAIEGDDSGLYILMDNDSAESLNIGYVRDVTDITKWTMTAKNLLALELAEKIAYAVTGKISVVNNIHAQKVIAQQEARFHNGISQPPRVYWSNRIQGAQSKFSTIPQPVYPTQQVMA